MIGLLFLAAIGLWFVLTLGFCLLWGRVRRSAGGNAGDPRSLVDALFGTLVIIWLSVSFWHGGGKFLYYDAEVRRLCAIDGGVKVYETVTLPAERFDEWGNPKRITYRDNMKESDEYYYVIEKTYLADGEIWRIRSVIVRREDEKVLGEDISYTGMRGSIYSLVFRSFSCPDPRTSPDLEKSIFLKGNEE